MEGHRNTVVHGPLNLINILDFWTDTNKRGNNGPVPKSVTYRAMSPLYVGEPYRIILGKEEKKEGVWKAEIWDSYGKASMKGTIVE